MQPSRHCCGLLLALALAGCGGGGDGGVVVVAPAVPPTSPGWQWQASSGVANPGSVDTFQFSFPASDGVHYLVKPWSGKVTSLTLDYTISGSGTFVALDKGQPEPGQPMVTLYFQTAGDTGLGQFGRWWGARGPLAPGDYTATATLLPELWTSVYGQHDAAQLLADSANVGTVGMTFGGTFYGHGVYVSGGTATFRLNRFQVN